MTPQNLIEKLNWRYAVKKFDASKKISQEVWQSLENALVLSPSSYGLQPWRFLVVQNPDLRKKLTPHSWNQAQVEDCSHYVVFTAKEKMDAEWVQKYIDRIVEVRGVTPSSLDGYKKMMLGDVVTGPRSQVAREWASKQVYIALGTLMTSAAVLGVDACPMEGIVPEKYDEILDLKGSGFISLVACALGYRSSQDPLATSKKVRFKNQEIVKYL